MKKILSIFLVALLVVACLPVTALAAGGAVVTVGHKDDANIGDTVSIAFDISTDEPFAGYAIYVDYDHSALKLDSITDVFGNYFATNASIDLASGNYNVNQDYEGTLFVANFVVTENAVAGATYPVSANVENVADEQINLFAVSVEPGYIQIKEEEKHEHSWSDWTVTEEPTCTEDGLKVRSCACGETQEEGISALGHAWDNGVVTKDPTCTEEGVMTFTCTRCGETKTEPIAVVDHIWAWYNPCCDGEGGDHRHVRECTICGTQKDAGACVGVEIGSNDLGNGKTETLYECSVCSHKWTVVTTSGTPVDPEPEDPNLDDVPRTDDITGQVVMTASAALICMVAAVAFIFKRKAAK